MNEELMKSLTSLIDESLAELEIMKKSDRFSATEIKLDGPGTGIAGKDPQGSLGKEEDKDEDEEDEDEEEKDEDKKLEMEKAESKEEDKKEDKKEDKDEDKKKDMDDMKKSLDEQSTLLKSYVDSKFASFETQLDKIAKLVSDIADAPVAPKSVSYKNIAPLKKSAGSHDEEGENEPLTKGQIVDKLFDLKKSGTRVDSADIASAELASGHDLAKIANKYNIK
jgi:cobalamin biosynthesis protein CobT